MIKKLKLKNWKCHLNSEFEFSFGTNALLGVMGAGKSSVLDAITFALFGTFPALHQRKIKLEDVIMKKPVRKNFAEIELEFEFNGKTYTVKRRIERRKSTQAELRINGRLVEVQPQRVNEFIEDVLKMDFDLFTRAIYSEQNRIDAFLNLPKGQRIKKIDEILKLERFEQARASVVTLINRFKSHLFELSRFIATLRSEINKEEIGRLKEDIQKINSELFNLKNEINLLQHKLEEIEKEKRTLIELRRKKEFFEKRMHSLNAEINLLEKELAEKKLPDLEFVKKRISEIEAKLKELESIYNEKEKNLIEIKKEKEKIELVLKEINENKKKLIALQQEKNNLENKLKNLENIEVELEKNKNILSEKRKEFFSLAAKIKELKKSLEELYKAKETCPVCDSELNEETRKKLIEKKKSDLELSTKNSMILENEIKEIENKIRQLEKNYVELKACNERIKIISNEISKLEEIVKNEEEIKNKVCVFEEKVKDLEKEKKEIEEKIRESKVFLEKEKLLEKEVIEIEKKKKLLEEKKIEIKKVEEELNKIKQIFSEEKLEKILEESKNLFADLKSKKEKVYALEKLKNEKTRMLELIERKIKDLERYEQEKIKVEQIISDLEKFKEALSITQTELRKNFISAVNQAMQSIWEELYPYGDFQSIRLHISEGDYVLQLQELDGSWISVEHVSGGERTLAALTLRIAFALVLAPQLRWLILDEPTHNLDIKAREELARVLRERITEFIDQVFLITHDPILEDAVSGVLYKIEREKEKNGVAKVIKVEEK
ncbi:MAG TPA: hypothetical protein EYH56_02400 [Nanoarchaeota archaeon]|nr:hypothetical protein [Nanoarchaeota archaeon]